LIHAGSFCADNANKVKSAADSVASLRARLNQLWNQWEISPFIGINNMFAKEYFDNIRLNASFDRYF
jgi:iron complex outermembrane receptor protein